MQANTAANMDEIAQMFDEADNEETVRLAVEFFDRVLIRDTNGTVVDAKIHNFEFRWIMAGFNPPTVPADLLEWLAALKRRPESQRELLNAALTEQWNRQVRSQNIVVKNSRLRYEERKNKLTGIEQIRLDACEPERNPTEATLVAKMYLKGTNGVPQDPEYASRLLIAAADKGNAEAAYLLATARKSDRPPLSFENLLDDIRLRERYLKQARAARFLKVFEDDERVKDFHADRHPSELKHELELDDDYQDFLKSYSTEHEKAQSGDHNAQYAFAMILLDQGSHLGNLYYELISKDPTWLQKREDLYQEAHDWLLKASDKSSVARYQLAITFSETVEEKFVLLKSAAFPEDDVAPCRIALSPLATEFYMNPSSEHHNPETGLKCLREYLALEHYQSIAGWCDFEDHIGDVEDYINDFKVKDIHGSLLPRFGSLPGDSEAALCFADYLHTVSPSDSDEQKNAYFWYTAVVTYGYSSDVSTAALRAGLMRLRGLGCEKDFKTAKVLLDRSRKGHGYASDYADVLYRLGFEEFEKGELAVDQLLKLAEEFKFKGDPDCFITPEDIVSLTSHNPHLESYREHKHELRGYRRRLDIVPGPYGLIPLFPEIAEGLVWVLQPENTISREELTKRWTVHSSMLERYAWASYLLANLDSDSVSFSEITDLEQRVNQVIQLAIDCLAEGNPHPPDIHEREVAQKIRAGSQILATELERKKLVFAIENDRRQMISFLSHTLVNVTAGASGMLREIMTELTAAHDHTSVALVAARLASTAARASVVESLIKVFKLYTSDPEILRKDWDSEQGGDHSVAQTVVLALQMTLLRFCRMPEFKSARRRLLPDVQYNTLTEEFISEILPLDGSSITQLEQITAWIELRLPFLRLTMSGAESLHVMEEGARHIVIFALVGEFLTNALKYAGAGGPISFSVMRTDIGLELACRNPIDSEMPPPPLSGKTGLGFVEGVCKLVHAKFDEPTIDKEVFSLRAVLPIQ